MSEAAAVLLSLLVGPTVLVGAVMLWKALIGQPEPLADGAIMTLLLMILLLPATAVILVARTLTRADTDGGAAILATIAGGVVTALAMAMLDIADDYFLRQTNVIVYPIFGLILGAGFGLLFGCLRVFVRLWTRDPKRDGA